MGFYAIFSEWPYSKTDFFLNSYKHENYHKFNRREHDKILLATLIQIILYQVCVCIHVYACDL